MCVNDRSIPNPSQMEKLLTIWPAYAPAFAIVSFGLAMRVFWGLTFTRLAIYFAWVIFVIFGLIWELTTGSALWARLLNGIFASVVAAVVFPEILESICSQTPGASQSGPPSD